MAVCRMARLRVGCTVAGWAPGVFWIVNSSWFQSTMVLPDAAALAIAAPSLVVAELDAAHEGAATAGATAAAPANAANVLVVFLIASSPRQNGGLFEGEETSSSL